MRPHYEEDYSDEQHPVQCLELRGSQDLCSPHGDRGYSEGHDQTPHEGHNEAVPPKGGKVANNYNCRIK